jgi:TetR/AcrR family transcriptional regulator
MGAREERNEKRAQDILDASLRLFVAKGYAGTTVRDVSKATGTSNGLLFHYFATKEEILLALAARAMESVASVAKLLRGGAAPLDIFERITAALLQAYRSEEGRDFFLLVNQIKTLASIPVAVKRKVASIDTIALSVPVVRKGQAGGVFKQGDPLGLALAYWGAVQGIGETLGWYRGAPVPDGRCILAILEK